eukprot:GHVU01044084.1.p1 GENE.GHVU01044084.1~~GHVU01044084.1.p1  ORF type:complete len:254 (+),score=54.95 GHVU01044084.1:438-1199(+)
MSVSENHSREMKRKQSWAHYASGVHTKAEVSENSGEPAVEGVGGEAKEEPWEKRLKETLNIKQFEDLKLDRQWYDAEESGISSESKTYDDSQLQEREKKKKKMNLFESARHVDQQLWETNQLRHSGLAGVRGAGPSAPAFYDESKVHVLVKEIKPPFLQNVDDNRVKYGDRSKPVELFRDPTGDLATIAKRGSAVLRELKKQEDRMKMRKKFWELAGSTLGGLLGVKSEAEKEARSRGERGNEEEPDYRQCCC